MAKSIALFFMLLISSPVECAATTAKFGALISRRKILTSELQASVTFKYSRKQDTDDEGYEGDMEENGGKNQVRSYRRKKRSKEGAVVDDDDVGGCRKKPCDEHFPDEDICYSFYGCNYCDGKLCTNFPFPPSIPDDVVVVDDKGDGGCPSKPCDELYPDVDICEDAYDCNTCDGRFCSEFTLPDPMEWE